MNLKERLEFCSICSKRVLNYKTGLLCSLTKEKPSFEGTCQDFIKDELEATRKLELNLHAAGNSRTENGSTKPIQNKIYGIALLILGLMVFLFSILIGGIMITTGISFLIKGYQQDKILKKHQLLQEKLSK
ncbi:MAG: hypothetical protein COB60_03795 [Flavobacteriaceae bacterium]|nr:MAG: hypothetical protein COB60_03795 [Flavobacteriaceae bacterium]